MATVMGDVKPEQRTTVNLEWKEYGDFLRNGLWDLFAEQLLVDVSLKKCADFKVHRFILAVFFRGLSKELTSRLDCLQDIGLEDLFGCDVDDMDVVRHLFEFTYSGRVTLPVDCLDKILSLAEAVGFDGLVVSIKAVLNGSPSSDDKSDCAKVQNDLTPAKEDVAVTTDAAASANTVVADGLAVAGCPLDSACHVDDDGNTGRRVQARRRSRKGSPVKIPYVRQTRSRTSVKAVISGATESKSSTSRRKKAPTKRQRREVACVESSQSSSLEDTEVSSDDEDSDWTTESNKGKVIRKRAIGSAGRGRRRQQSSTAEESSPALVNGKAKARRLRLKCDQCDYTTSDKVTYANHQAKHDPSMNVHRFQCDLCSKTFRSRRGFRCHLKTHGGPEEQFHCAICSYNTPQKWSWRQHMAVMHKVDADTGVPLSANHRCDQCDFECVAMHQLKAHLQRKHAPDKPFKCTECAYETINKSQLAKHVSVSHRKERHYMCDECGFRSQTQSGLNRHKRSHLGLKPFKCAECGMAYADSGKYKDHLLRHTTDEKPFVCHVCAHSCRRRDNLRMHLKRIHNLTLANEASFVGGQVRSGTGELQQPAGVVVIEVPALALEQAVAALDDL